MGENKTPPTVTVNLVKQFSNNEGRGYIRCKLNGEDMKPLLDSGSSKTLISKELFDKLKLEKQSSKRVNFTLKSASNNELIVLGEINPVINIEGYEFVHQIFVIQGLAEPLIFGSDLLRSHQFVIDYKLQSLYNRQTKTPMIAVQNQNLVGKVLIIETITEEPDDYILAINCDDAKDLEQCDVAEDEVARSRDHKKPPETMTKAERVAEILKRLKIHENSNLTEEQVQKVRQLIENYCDIFALNRKEVTRTTLIEQEIHLHDHTPIIERARRIPIHLFAEVEAEVAELLAAGIIVESEASTNIPVILSKKGTKFRLLLDMRKTNSQTIKEYSPIPSVDSLLTGWEGCSFWSQIDLRDAYYSVPLRKQDQDYTSFGLPGIGKFKFQTSCLGLTNAPAVFSRLMDRLLSGLKADICQAFLDDICSGAQTFDEMLNNITIIFDRMRMGNLRLKPSKCGFFKQSIDFLGMRLSKEGILPLHNKVEAITHMAVPHNKKSLLSFLGSVNYYRQFIPKFTEKAKGLLDCLKANEKGKHVITEEAKESFNVLKMELVNPQILIYPSVNRKIVLYTDSSQYSVGAVIGHEIDNHFRPIAFGSKLLNETQQRWPTFKREFYAVYFFIERYRLYCLAADFIVRVDHKAITCQRFMAKTNSSIILNWIIELQSYKFDIEFVKGTDNKIADSLSRIPAKSDQLYHYFKKIHEGIQLEKIEVRKAKREGKLTLAVADVKNDVNSTCAKNDVQGSEVDKNDVREPCDTSDTYKSGIRDGDVKALEAETGLKTMLGGDDITRIEHSIVVNAVDNNGDDGSDSCNSEQEEDVIVGQSNDVEHHELDDNGEEMQTDDEDINIGFDGVNNEQKSNTGHEHLVWLKEGDNIKIAPGYLGTFERPFQPIRDLERKLLQAQVQDDVINQLKLMIVNDTFPTGNSDPRMMSPEIQYFVKNKQRLLINDDNLVTFVTLNSTTKKYTALILTPLALRKTMLMTAHDIDSAAHTGFAKMLTKIGSHYFWYNLALETKFYAQTCSTCYPENLQYKRKPKGRLMPYGAGTPNFHVQIDLIGPIAKSKQQKRWILSIICMATRYATAISLYNAKTSSVVQGLIKGYIAHEGIPYIISSDQGGNLDKADLIKELYNVLQIRKVRSSGYNPECQGQVENYNRTVVNALRKVTKDFPHTWTFKLPIVCLAINSSVNSTTGYTPFFLMRGRRSQMAEDLAFGTVTSTFYQSHAHLASQLYYDTKEALEYTRINITKKQIQQQEYFNRSANPVKYAVGDQVLLRRHTPATSNYTKLISKWMGVYTITRKVGENAYEVKKNGTKEIIVRNMRDIRPLPKNLRPKPTNDKYVRLNNQRVDKDDEPRAPLIAPKNTKDDDGDDDDDDDDNILWFANLPRDNSKGVEIRRDEEIPTSSKHHQPQIRETVSEAPVPQTQADTQESEEQSAIESEDLTEKGTRKSTRKKKKPSRYDEFDQT